MRVTKLIVRCVAPAGIFLLVACSVQAGERKFIQAKVEPGGEVLVAHHKNYDKVCQPLAAPTIKITRQPANGAVAVRHGTFVIKDRWARDAERTCVGKSVPGLGVYYRANQSFRGVDTFEYKLMVGSGMQTYDTFGVEVQVTVK